LVFVKDFSNSQNNKVSINHFGDKDVSLIEQYYPITADGDLVFYISGQKVPLEKISH